MRFPLAAGKEWEWGFDVNGSWSPNERISWKGIEHFAFKYKVNRAEDMSTCMGSTPCYHIHATGVSRFGIATNDIYYSRRYGIVRMFYSTTDSTNIAFNLLSMVNDKKLFKALFNIEDTEQNLWDIGATQRVYTPQ